MAQRLIDANKLVLRFEYGIQADGLLFVPFRDMKKSVNKAPTVDAVPVVRCKDCKRWQRHSDVNRDYGGCRRYSSTMRYDDFCSYGERRERNADR